MGGGGLGVAARCGVGHGGSQAQGCRAQRGGEEEEVGAEVEVGSDGWARRQRR